MSTRVTEAQRNTAVRSFCDFVVPGRVVPYPRAGRSGRRTYMPQRYMDYLGEVQTAARQAWLGQPLMPGRVEVGITFFGLHGSADIDNAAKTILDGMQGIIYENDRQVRMLEVNADSVEESDSEGPETLVNVTALR